MHKYKCKDYGGKADYEFVITCDTMLLNN